MNGINPKISTIWQNWSKNVLKYLWGFWFYENQTKDEDKNDKTSERLWNTVLRRSDSMSMLGCMAPFSRVQCQLVFLQKALDCTMCQRSSKASKAHVSPCENTDHAGMKVPPAVMLDVWKTCRCFHPRDFYSIKKKSIKKK